MLKKSCLLTLFLCVLLTALPVLADADYSITDYSMDVLLHPDGSASVTETLVYDFDGEYNGILSLFDADGLDAMTDFSVFIDGVEMTPVDSMEYEFDTYTLTQTGSLYEARVYSPGEDDVRTVAYQYTMQALAKRYEDAGMILRKFIGENNSVSLHDAIVTVRFPEGASSSQAVRAFAHGGMDSENVALLNGAVVFGPKTVYSGHSVEMRLLFPAEWIADAPLQPGAILADALNEEQRMMDEAARTAHLLRISKYILSAVFTLLSLLTPLLLMKKYGVKGKIKQTDLERLTAWPAAFAKTALSGAVDTDAFSGTLMELVQLSRVRMEDEQGDLRFTRIVVANDDLYPHQRTLMQHLFGSRESILLSELNAGSSYTQAQTFEKGYNAYCNQVAQDMIHHSLKYKNDGVRIAFNAIFILVGLVLVALILLAGKAEVILGCAVLLITFLSIFLMNKVRTLTDEGERLRNAAQALHDQPIASGDALIAYLPYYAALGLTDPLVQAQAARPDDLGDAAPYLYGGWYYGVHHLSSSMRDIHLHNASVPNPNASSGSPGGYSGSNGGGGGHGAW